MAQFGGNVPSKSAKDEHGRLQSQKPGTRVDVSQNHSGGQLLSSSQGVGRPDGKSPTHLPVPSH